MLKNRCNILFLHQIIYIYCKEEFYLRMKRDRYPNMGKREDEVISRYENSVRRGNPCYFEVDEMETIINHYMDDEMPGKAMDAVQYGRKLHPNSTSLLVKQARLYADTGQTKEALSIIKYIETIDSGDEDAVLLKGEILLRSGKREDAMKIFKEMEEDAEESYETLLNIAYALNDNRLFDDAIRYLTKAGGIKPNNTDILFELAYSLEQKEEITQAIDTYDKILDITPYSNEAWINIGQLHLLLEHYPEAAEAFDYAYTINANDYQSLLQKANALLLCERYQEAVDALEEYADLAGESPNTNILLGECYEKTGNFSTAKKYYRRAVDLDKDSEDGLVGLCICCLELEDAEGALKNIEKLFELKGATSEFWIYKAEAYVIGKERKKAICCYQNALAITPDQPDVIIAIGNLFADEQQFDIALHYYQKAQMLQNDIDGLPLLLAISFYKTKDYQMCVKNLSKAIRSDAMNYMTFLEFCPEAQNDPNILGLNNLES